MASKTWAVKETGTLGREYGSPHKFSDMPALETFRARGQLPQMKQVDVHTDGRLVYGLEVTYDGAVSHAHLA